MKTRLRLFYKVILIIVLFRAGLIIAGIIFPIINATCSINKARDNCNQLKVRWLKCFSGILNLRIKIEGAFVDGAAILVSNHISWLDIIAIGQHLPCCFVAKNDILNWPVIGYLAVQGGTIFIRRGDKQHVRATAEKMVWLLKQNCKIIAFPEGTTSDGANVLPFIPPFFNPHYSLNQLSSLLPLNTWTKQNNWRPSLVKMLSYLIYCAYWR